MKANEEDRVQDDWNDKEIEKFPFYELRNSQMTTEFRSCRDRKRRRRDGNHRGRISAVNEARTFRLGNRIFEFPEGQVI